MVNRRINLSFTIEHLPFTIYKVSFYPEKINKKIRQPKYVGQLTDASAVGTGASFVCGTFVRFFVRIETDGKEIVEAKYKTSGCGFVVAAAEVLCARITGKKLFELHGLDESDLQTEIEIELDKFPDERAHCLKICLNSLRSAFDDFRSVQIEEFAGERALICTCFGVSEETIENLVKENLLETIEEVTAHCNAGGGCGSCQPLIQDILDNFESGVF